VVLLIAKALQSHYSNTTTNNSSTIINGGATHLINTNPSSSTNNLITHNANSTIASKQLQLASIIEMIHTASIVHDDVIDVAVTRRGVASVNQYFNSNKLAILSGDYLLARASICLSWLENFEVTRLISTVISDLVEGELMQMKPTPSAASKTSPSSAPSSSSAACTPSPQQQQQQQQQPLPSVESIISGLPGFDYYLKKTYYKTASLIANGCRATGVLGVADPRLLEMASEYGKNLGLAFQLVDDMLDFTSSSTTLGKPASVDLSLGLATAPVLFAREEHPELSVLIERKFEVTGDVEKARNFVQQSRGIVRTRELAATFCDLAVRALIPLRPSPAKSGLIRLADLVLNREK